MPPRRNSRYANTFSTDDGTGRQFLAPREKFTFRELEDNIVHIVKKGDTLQNLAARFYANLSTRTISAATLYWVIADFQPKPIHDPTIQLVEGTRLVAPSERVVRERVLTGNFDT